MELTTEAKRIVETTKFCAVATIYEGRPWNTPVAFAMDDEANIYWRSADDAIHSQNVRNNGRAFIVIYDSHIISGQGARTGLYLDCEGAEMDHADEISAALAVMATRFGRHPPLESGSCLAPSPLRLYRATPTQAWINDVHPVEVDDSGPYHVDIRTETPLS